MDIDEIIDDNASDHGGQQNGGQGSSKGLSRRATIIQIDDEHPFELDAYISAYTGMAARFH
jgi:hypothetical protein